MLALEIASPSTEDWAVPVTAMRVQEWRDREGQLCALAYTDGRSGWLEWPGLATFAFTEGSGDVVAIPHPLTVPSTRLTIEDIFRRSARPIILQAIGCARVGRLQADPELAEEPRKRPEGRGRRQVQ